MSNFTVESSNKPAPFPIELCHDRKVKLYRSNNDNVFRIGKYIVRIDTNGPVVLNQAPEGVIFAQEAQECVVVEAITVCNGYPRDSNTWAYLHNFDKAGIEKCFGFCVEFVGVFLSVEKHTELGWTAKWTTFERANFEQAAAKAEFIKGLNE